MPSEWEDTAPMNTRADDVDLGVKVNRVVPLWGIILVVGGGLFNVIQNWNAQKNQQESIARLETSVVALTLKLDGILTTQNQSALADAQHDLKIGYINDQIANLRNRMSNVETVLPRQYIQQPQTVIQMPESTTQMPSLRRNK